MFALKDYQQKALAALDRFFRRVRTVGLEAAWRACAPLHEKNGYTRPANYDSSALSDVPAVCVRIPTGGGKTFLAAHAVAHAGKTLRDTAAPVALWLVPSDAIRSQTLAALTTQRNPCREALTQHFGERVRVCALDDLATVGPQEVDINAGNFGGNCAVIIVATIQSFNVKDKTSVSVQRTHLWVRTITLVF
jgi:type III restriction enzyme